VKEEVKFEDMSWHQIEYAFRLNDWMCRNNDIQKLVESIDREYNQAFVGRLGREENIPIIYQWTGEQIEHGSIDFVVPRLDRVLVDLLAQRINGTYPGPAWASLFFIGERVRKIGGRLIHWPPMPDYIEETE
jgi:hypothetical protein